MRALVVHPHFHGRYTGVTRHVESVVPELVRQLEAQDVRVIGRTVSESLLRTSWGELWERARQGPVVWHAHRNNEMLAGLLLRWWGRQVRLVYTRHAATRPSWLTRWLAGRADARVSISEPVAAALGMASRVVGHGIDLERFRPPDEGREEAWKRLELGGRYGVGVIGRIRPEKGQGDFIEAVRPLLPRHGEWKAVLVGRAKDRDAEWVDQLCQGLGDTLVRVGEQREVERWFQGLTVLVHPSHSEGYGLVRVEAMAAGCCVVASRLEGLDMGMEHGRTGFFYEPGDARGLREVLELLMREPGRAEEVGKQAAEHARKHFGVEHEARALGALYRELLEGR